MLLSSLTNLMISCSLKTIPNSLVINENMKITCSLMQQFLSGGSYHCFHVQNRKKICSLCYYTLFNSIPSCTISNTKENSRPNISLKKPSWNHSCLLFLDYKVQNKNEMTNFCYIVYMYKPADSSVLSWN